MSDSPDRMMASIKGWFPERNVQEFTLSDPQDFKRRVLQLARQFDPVCYLDHNQYPDLLYHSFDALIGLGAEAFIQPNQAHFEALRALVDTKKTFLFGYLAYDLKNQIEKLQSRSYDPIGFPDLHFFEPKIWIGLHHSTCIIAVKEVDPNTVFDQIQSSPLPNIEPIQETCEILARMDRSTYLEKVKAVKNHILEGDIYELNFCQEFYCPQAIIDPWETCWQLNQQSKAPFASFYRLQEQYLIGGSPERFLKKEGKKLISQPIKGTSKRGRNLSEDEQQKQALRASHKDQAENVMIVDLVRNDLAKSCQSGTVNVEELFGIYAFENVFQMISTVTGELRPNVHLVEAIVNAFPMGSMTGAPKIRSMQLIEQYEESRRGLYSGSVGYIDPNGNFDFNVVIRSILYNAKDQYLSFQVGGAIVYDSIPEKEYEECLLKATNVMKTLGLEWGN
ncbi:MAG: anthranilate synthase component I family protein [Bacteroidota bacterium]